MWLTPIVIVSLGILIGDIVLTLNLKAKERITTTPPALPVSVEKKRSLLLWRGLAIGVFLTTIYTLFLWLVYGLLAPWLVLSVGVSYRSSWFSVTILSLMVLPAIWYLYDTTGMPGRVESITKARKVILPVVLSFFAWWYINQPDTLFNHQTGEVKFWVAEKESKIYYSPGYSPVTGEELRPGTPADVEKYKKRPLIESLRESATKTTPTVIDWTQPLVVQLSADGSFSDPLPLALEGKFPQLQKSGDIWIKFPDNHVELIKWGEKGGRVLPPAEKRFRFASATGKKEIVIVNWVSE